MRIVVGLRAFALATCLVVVAGCGGSNAGLPNLADLVDRVSPSVVNISAVPVDNEQVAQSTSTDPHQVPDWLKKFLEKHGEHGSPAPGKPGKPGSADPGGDVPGDNGGDAPQDGEPGDGGLGGEQSLGSGFVLWSDGYILTNHHVVRDSRDVVVRLSDRRQFPATVIGSDERSDIALLKIDATDLPAVKIADVKKSRVGDWVLAIGSPFGFDYTVTSGILSAKGRSLPTEQYVPFLQTDAAVNPGNSGGPLFNLKGEVLGINSQIYSQSGGFQGVAFAIPIDIAVKVATALKEHGKVLRGWLGIVMQEVDRNLAKSFGMDKPGGALISRVLPDGPAEQAGLKAGDIILKYNGTEVPSWQAIKPLVGDSHPGDVVTLDLLRDGKVVTIKVEVGTLESQDQPEGADGRRGSKDGDGPKFSPVPPPAAPGASDRPLGLQVEALSDEARKAAKVVSGGVRVVQVSPGPARDAGAIPGDVILAIAGQEIGSPDRYAEVVSRLTPGQSVPLLVQRQGSPLFLALSVPAKP